MTSSTVVTQGACASQACGMARLAYVIIYDLKVIGFAIALSIASIQESSVLACIAPIAFSIQWAVAGVASAVADEANWIVGSFLVPSTFAITYVSTRVQYSVLGSIAAGAISTRA